MYTGPIDSTSRLHMLLASVIDLANQKAKIDEELIIAQIDEILANTTVKPIKLDNVISIQTENNASGFSPLYWVGALKLKRIAEKLLDEQINKSIDLNLPQFENERQLYANQSLEEDFLRQIEKIQNKNELDWSGSDFEPLEKPEEFADDEFTITEYGQGNQYENWNIHHGFNPEVHQILMPQLAKRNESVFALNNVYSVTLPESKNAENIGNPPFTFRTNDDQRNIMYFPPTLVSYVTNEKETPFDPKDNAAIAKYLKFINTSCQTLDKKTRFILPLMEIPKPKGTNHSTLLCMDYDPATKKLKPVVFDSLTRNLDAALQIANWQYHNTCDATLQSAFSQIFTNTNESNIQVEPLVRLDYGHQNLIEDNCGSYTFRLAQMAAEEYATYDTLEGLYKHIPTPNGWIISNNFLTPAHIKELETVMRSGQYSDPNLLKNLQKVSTGRADLSSLIINKFVDDLFIDQIQVDNIQEDILNNLSQSLKDRSIDKANQIFVGDDVPDVPIIDYLANIMSDDAVQNKNILSQISLWAQTHQDTQDSTERKILLAILALQELKNITQLRNRIIHSIVIKNEQQLLPSIDDLPLEKFPEYSKACNQLQQYLTALQKNGLSLKEESLSFIEQTVKKNGLSPTQHPAFNSYISDQQEFQNKYHMHYAAINNKSIPQSEIDNASLTSLNEKICGKTPLYLAAERGNHDLVAQLYKKGANIDACGPNNDSGFVAAARLGHSNVVNTILNIRASSWTSGMERRKRDSNGKTAFHYLAMNRDMKTCLSFLQSVTKGSFSDFTDILDNHGESALHIIARNGDITLLNTINSFSVSGYLGSSNYYIEDIFPKSLHQKNIDGFIPIELAAQQGHREVVQLLAQRMKLSPEQTKVYEALCDDQGKQKKRMLSAFSLSKENQDNAPQQENLTASKKNKLTF